MWLGEWILSWLHSSSVVGLSAVRSTSLLEFQAFRYKHSVQHCVVSWLSGDDKNHSGT